MLPFMHPKKIVSVMIAQRGKPDLEASPEVEAPGQEIDPDLKECAQDVLRAIESKSPIALAKALKAAFEVCDSMPHEEGPHPEEAGE